MIIPAPRVSVVMPVYNCALFLSAALDSILKQSFQDFECIVIDDGSTDGSELILSDYAKKSPRITVLRNSVNMGIVHALNRGLKECRGEFIASMDADDIALPDRLEKQVRVMEAQPDIAVLGSAVRYIDAAGADLGIVRQGAAGRSPLFQNPLLHPTAIMRRDILLQHAIVYEEPYRYAEDYFLWLRMSRYGRLASLDEVLLLYRIYFEASRFRHTRVMLARTLRAKCAGVFKLGIRPQIADILRFAAECLLLLMPAGIIRRLYLKHTFGNMAKPKL